MGQTTFLRLFVQEIYFSFTPALGFWPSAPPFYCLYNLLGFVPCLLFPIHAWNRSLGNATFSRCSQGENSLPSWLVILACCFRFPFGFSRFLTFLPVKRYILKNMETICINPLKFFLWRSTSEYMLYHIAVHRIIMWTFSIRSRISYQIIITC